LEVAVRPVRSPSADTLAIASDKKGGKKADQPGSAPSHEDGKADDEPKAAPRRCAPLSRRRGAALEEAIYQAVLQQMSTVGFTAMTMEGVAACAHTGKAALYRRWQSKEDLVADTLDNVLPSYDLPPDTGSARDDIAEVFRRMATTMASPAGCAMLSLFGELDPDHEFIQVLHSQVLAPRKAMMLEILRRGAARGDVRPDAVKQIVADTGPALLVHWLLMYGPPIDAAYLQAVLDDVVMPLIQSASGSWAAAAPRRRTRAATAR
jgi:AcrR family transcriptional regulator